MIRGQEAGTIEKNLALLHELDEEPVDETCRQRHGHFSPLPAFNAYVNIDTL